MGYTNPSMFRRFRLWRDEDVSGCSGIGFVAEGVRFTNGKVALAFLQDLGKAVKNVEVFDSIDDVVAIHGHEGRTKVIWYDN